MNPGFFEAFYNSPIQHPVLLWASNLVGTSLALLALRLRTDQATNRVRRFILFWALVSAFDAWLSANRVFGIGALTAPWSSIIPLFFVWIGDFRVFLSMELFRAGFPDQAVKLQWWRPVLACWIVPIVAGLLTRGRDSRVLFLVYEALFMVMITGYGRFTGTIQNPAAKRVRNLSWVFYFLWASADVAILVLPESLRDLGFAIRVLPNLIYYGAFGWVCARVSK